MRTDTSQTIYRNDYTPPSYLVETVELGFDLDPARTIVANRMAMRRNPDSERGARSSCTARTSNWWRCA
jgi:aminopeptidase N